MSVEASMLNAKIENLEIRLGEESVKRVEAEAAAAQWQGWYSAAKENEGRLSVRCSELTARVDELSRHYEEKCEELSRCVGKSFDAPRHESELSVRCAKAELEVVRLTRELETERKWNQCTAEDYCRMRDKLEAAQKRCAGCCSAQPNVEGGLKHDAFYLIGGRAYRYPVWLDSVPREDLLRLVDALKARRPWYRRIFR